MPDLTWNKAVWADSYHWADGGEEWSTTWRGSEAQWLGSILSSAASFLAGAADSENRAWTRTLDKISAARMRQVCRRRPVRKMHGGLPEDTFRCQACPVRNE